MNDNPLTYQFIEKIKGRPFVNSVFLFSGNPKSTSKTRISCGWIGSNLKISIALIQLQV